ncbi:MAG: adenylate/guanylate cyclase domain-containing protein [Thermodesulfovibrionales bacterium]|nr:adenylate/guanylate cyclase domain-containing protein [Thermodesulfovibrionales bacterium]
MPETFKLNITSGERKDETYPLLNFPFRIGRAADNDIAFEDKRVSRHHTEIFLSNGEYFIKDLGSQNGTWVNGVKITSTGIKTGDAIIIGGNTLLFDSGKEDIFVEADTSDLQTIIKPAKDILIGTIEEKDDGFSPDILRKRTAMLSALYQISRDILKESEIDSILNLTANTILGNIKAERVYILMKDEELGSIKTALARDAGKISGKEDKLMLSRTVINRVMDEEISLLVADAKRDSRFKESESIFMYGIRSAMCVPLLGAERVTGAIYVDILNSDRQFTHDELHLLTTIGNISAIGIEQTNLRDKMLKEREARQSLMRYHSPQVVEEIIKGKGTCEVSERMITVLFTDIKGFTRLSEELGPMETVRLLNEYFDIITDVVFRYKGSIDKFIGDAAMAIFGAPFHDMDYTEMAVKAAIDIQKEIKKLNKFEVRIGINTGTAVIGNIGSSKRVEYTAIGDTINIASRLEKMAAEGSIYIGEATYEQIKGIFKTRSIGMQKIKGKTMEVGIYEVIYE